MLHRYVDDGAGQCVVIHWITIRHKVGRTHTSSSNRGLCPRGASEGVGEQWTVVAFPLVPVRLGSRPDSFPYVPRVQTLDFSFRRWRVHPSVE